ncbi:MAG: helix-turn-helix transcriptional regulator, partial [Anaerolineae bacterium]
MLNSDVIGKQVPATRRRILIALKESGSLTADELAEALNISAVAVRRHLSNLERDHLVTHREAQRGMGRPSFIYELTPEASCLFPHNYDQMATYALTAIEELYGQQAIEAIFQKRAREQAQAYSPLMDGKCLEDRLDQLVRLREQEGYMPTWEIGDDDVLILKEANCPIMSVAEHCGQACASELNLFVELLDAEVVRQDHLLDGAHLCSYAVRPRQP